MISRRVVDFFVAVSLIVASQAAHGCYWCNWFVCAWESGPGRLHCVTTCFGGTGDPGDNCWCVASGPFCWGAQAPGTSSWFASAGCAAAALRSAATPATCAPGASGVGAQHTTIQVRWSAPAVTSASQTRGAALGANRLPKGCVERAGAEGERIVECAAPGYHGPAAGDAFSFSADSGLLLQLAEFDRSLAYALHALQRASQSAPLDLGGGELFASVPTDVGLVRDAILGRRIPRNADGRPERFEFVRIVLPTDDMVRFQLRRVDDPNGPAVDIELTRSEGAATSLRVIRWLPVPSVRKRPTAI
jgi:hypothetical protein